jgi:ABC-type lipoprotein release transport system permease subunit
LAVILCVAAGSAALSGALVVGDSMRGSLREQALRRLGPVDEALVAPRFFREQLAADLAADASFGGEFSTACPVVLLRAAIHHSGTAARANRINVLGVDDRFWNLDGEPPHSDMAADSRTVVLNQALADEIGAKAGDDVLLRLVKMGAVPTETILGRPDDTATSLRLTVRRIVSTNGLGGVGFRPSQAAPMNAFVPLVTLQQAIGQRERVNTILVTNRENHGDAEDQAQASRLDRLLADHLQLSDCDLRLRKDEVRHYFTLETDRLLIEPPAEAAARQAAGELKTPALPVLTYLANEISLVDAAGAPRGRRGIPYSTITALDPQVASFLPPVFFVDGTQPGSLAPDEILLNQWAAADLGAGAGDFIKVTYYVSRPMVGLVTESTVFRLKGVVPIAGWAGDPGLMPTYPGISDAKSMADWDPPPSLKIDLSRNREKDELYWQEHRGTPKAFVSLETGRRLWAESGGRFGSLTSIFFGAGPQADLKTEMSAFEKALLNHLPPSELGLRFEAVRAEALEAGAGSTDFSGLFIGFSFFVIAAAAMLVALVFRLGVERRTHEVGLYLAVGFTVRRVRRMLLAEGTWLAAAGSLLGLAAAIGYAWLMLAGLRSWWAEAVNAPFLQIHVEPLSLAIGLGASFAVGLLSIAWSLRGLMRSSPAALLAGNVASGTGAQPVGRVVPIVCVASLVLGLGAVISALASQAVPKVPAFFVGGAAMLVAGLAAFSWWMRGSRGELIRKGGVVGMLRIGIRNVARSSGRSVMTASLIACSCFIIVAVGAFRHEADAEALDAGGGTGGYSLLAEAIIPLQYDLNTADGRDSLNVAPSTAAMLKPEMVIALRLKPGDDTSCLNLYKVRSPKILGAPDAMIQRGGFSFAGSMAESPEERANPWQLLHRTFEDGAVPAIGDANTITYLLKLGIGEDFPITDQRGRRRALRIVGMLSGSVLQGELIIGEQRFTDLFPSITGHGFLLIDAPATEASRLGEALERDLGDFGLDVESTLTRLKAYEAVENTYLSTFQTLGGFGLILGTLGLGAVMLRNVLERRGELALLRAVGYRPSGLGWMVFAENAWLLVVGLLIGGSSALLAVAPNAVSRPGQIPWVSLGWTLTFVTLAGLTSSAAALRSTLRTPLLPALRRE